MRRLLLEIGVEELPARFIPTAMEQLTANAGRMLGDAKLSPESIRVSATPRRLALICTGIPDMQPDQVREVKGPPLKAAYDADGHPTRAAEGFARGQGVPVSDLYRATADGGDYVFARVEEKGRPAQDVLQQLLPGLILSLSFPKAMRWADLDIRWARPIRWIVALLDKEVVEFELGSVRSGRKSFGLRFLHPDPLIIPGVGEYAGILRDAHVILDQEERHTLIRRLVHDTARREGGLVDDTDEELFAEVTNINEYPSVVVGRFDPKYLGLPAEVVITPMRQHQRFFPVYNPGGQLMPLFITIRNGLEDEHGYVQQGNEKVLAARLADAAFFYEEDRKVPLEARLERLETLVFQEKLGTMRERVRRLEALVPTMCCMMGCDQLVSAQASRAARLAKSDLVTHMVFEFPELQGIMGAHYARAGGEDPRVAQAISEQYHPRSAGGALPSSQAGRALALADKIDALTGYFAVGLIPTGSQDPFALRRAALGVIAILRDAACSIDLNDLFTEAYKQYENNTALKNDRAETIRLLDEFFRGRLRVALIEDGFRYDLVDAVLSGGVLDPFALTAKTAAIQDVSATAAFSAALAGYSRAANLAAKAEQLSLDPAALKNPEDLQLWHALQTANEQVDRALGERQVSRAIEALASLRKPIDAYFDAVLVMDPDADIRRNRLAMLRLLTGLFNRLVDWSRIVQSGS